MTVAITGVRSPRADQDGRRVLVDRLWPRGLAKDRADWDGWLKDVAPSTQLRTWWHHDPERQAEFAERYRAELASNPAVAQLRAWLVEYGTITLLTATHDPAASHLPVLRAVIEDADPSTPGPARP